MAATSMRAHTHTPLQTINRGFHFMRPLRTSHHGRQKSAVELLQESKCLYVKSETVLDHQQQLQSGSPDATSFHSSVVKVRGPPVPPKSAQLRRSYNCTASTTDQLQAKLRRLLNADSKENLIEGLNVTEVKRMSPQLQRQSMSCPVHHKSLPDLHMNSVITATSTVSSSSSESNSSEPTSCEYQLYTTNRKSSSTQQSTNEDISVKSSQSRSKNLSSQANSHSPSDGSRNGLSLTLASPVESSSSATNTANRRRHTASDEEDCDDMARLRPILRSKSDVGHRGIKLTSVNIAPSTPADLNTFFNQLGLDSPEFQSVTRPRSDTSSPVFFSDTSSLDSTTLCTAAINQSAGGSEGAAGSSGELPSIVERNARIIKWLCNCRKAHLSLPPPPPGFLTPTTPPNSPPPLPSRFSIYPPVPLPPPGFLTPTTPPNSPPPLPSRFSIFSPVPLPPPGFLTPTTPSAPPPPGFVS